MRYISQNNVSLAMSPLNTTLSCGVAHVNATHRVIIQYEEATGLCPDLAALAAAEGGFAASGTTGVALAQAFARVDGVLPGDPVLVCKNSTKALAPPLSATNSGPLAAAAPADLGSPGGATTPTGVWKNAGSMQAITPTGFLVSYISADGLLAINGRYLSHKCIDADSYYASNEQLIIYPNGTTVKGFHCEKTVRDGDTLALTFSNGPDCAAMAADAPADETYTLAAAIPGIPTECGAVVPGPAPAPAPKPVPPVSSAGRAALGGAVAAAIAAVFL